jgi:hypothetical protein
MVSKAIRKSTTTDKKSKETWNTVSWIVIAVLLVAGGAYFVYQPSDTGPGAQAGMDYALEDVARDRPFRAIHEMGAGPAIPFLPADQPQPKIVVPNDYYDFGRVGASAVVKREFLVRNEGEAPLTISRAYTTCGCTIGEFTARVIPPGKVALVTLVFDAGFHDARGQTVKRGIIIESNDRGDSRAEVWIKASVGQN